MYRFLLFFDTLSVQYVVVRPTKTETLQAIPGPPAESDGFLAALRRPKHKKAVLRDDLSPAAQRRKEGGTRNERGYFLLATSEKCLLVSRTTTPDRPTRAIRLGRAMRPLRVSAIAQASFRSMVAPTKMTRMKMI